MLRITRRAWPEMDWNGKTFWVIWRPVYWSHPVLARAGGAKNCRQARVLALVPPKRPLFGVFLYNPFKRPWRE